MADDLISRKAAIEALMEFDKKLRKINWHQYPYTEHECRGVDKAIVKIANLPSAQPKLKLVDITDISEIFEPKFTEEEIQMMQELEAAEIEKAYQLGMEDAQPVDKDINVPINDTISRQAAIDALEWTWAGKAAFDAINNLPSVQPEQPSREYVEQIKWERDLAIQQLKDLGYGLGEKPRTQDYKTDHGYMWLCPKCGLPVHSDFEKCVRCGYER